MSNEKINRLHPITILLNFISQVKAWIIPAIAILISGGFRLSFNPKTDEFYEMLIGFGVMLLFGLIFLAIAIIKWRKFIYWFEDGEIRIEYGIFVKKKRYIPFRRIQTLNYTEGIFHRLLKLVKVELETAASGSDEAELSLTAVTKEKAEEVEQQMRLAKNATSLEAAESSSEEAIEQQPVFEQPKTKSIYKIKNKELIFLASTSSSIGIVFSALAAISSQLDDWIPYEAIYGEMKNMFRLGAFLIVFIALIIILISWGISIILSYFVNYGFRLEEQDEKLLISKGLLEKKKVTIPLERVQSIRIIENPLRQLFGYCQVSLDSAGAGGEGEGSVVILPFTKKKEALEIVKEIFPQYEMEQNYTKVPKKSLLRYLLKPLYFWVFPVAAAIYFLPSYGWISLIILPLVVALAYWQYRTAGFALAGLQLTLVFRRISKTTFIVPKNRIQSMTLSQSFFAERKDVATVDARVLQGGSSSTNKAKHFDLKDMRRLMTWYLPK